MGLDMYLRGRKFFWTNWNEPHKNRTEDDCKVTSLEVELGYWRKHPNLHGYIVQTFAAGVDECQEIELSVEQLEQIITAVKLGKLPETDGFFFGSSPTPDDLAVYNDQIDEDVKVLQKALSWLQTPESGVSRDVFYRASW